ncbi:hypothetical protein CF319_g589 [Tilletia indica]|nr:hypothetical protein CF319_g589 [Tilletia indica]
MRTPHYLHQDALSIPNYRLGRHSVDDTMEHVLIFRIQRMCDFGLAPWMSRDPMIPYEHRWLLFMEWARQTLDFERIRGRLTFPAYSTLVQAIFTIGMTEVNARHRQALEYFDRPAEIPSMPSQASWSSSEGTAVHTDSDVDSVSDDQPPPLRLPIRRQRVDSPSPPPQPSEPSTQTSHPLQRSRQENLPAVSTPPPSTVVPMRSPLSHNDVVSTTACIRVLPAAHFPPRDDSSFAPDTFDSFQENQEPGPSRQNRNQNQQPRSQPSVKRPRF